MQYELYEWKFNGGNPGYFKVRQVELDDYRDVVAIDMGSNTIFIHPDIAVLVNREQINEDQVIDNS